MKKVIIVLILGLVTFSPTNNDDKATPQILAFVACYDILPDHGIFGPMAIVNRIGHNYDDERVRVGTKNNVFSLLAKSVTPVVAFRHRTELRG